MAVDDDPRAPLPQLQPVDVLTMAAPPMSQEQRRLARHALGLDNSKRRSYRNRYLATNGSKTNWEWEQMVSAGWARIGLRQRVTTLYELTTPGALAAIDPGEHLDPEDFPEVAQ
jgi:hypothetical protein